MENEKTGNKRRESYSHVKLDAKRARKRAEAEKRQKACAKLSITDRLAGLDLRPGESKRERKRLTVKLTKV